MTNSYHRRKEKAINLKRRYIIYTAVLRLVSVFYLYFRPVI